MEVISKKLGIKIVSEKASDDFMIIQKILNILENLPKRVRSKMAKTMVKPDFYFAVALYKDEKITLGKFAEIVGLSFHDSARLLDSMGIDVGLGPRNSTTVKKEVEVAEGMEDD